jgi:hypothetical protein
VPVEVVTDRAPTYPRVLDALWSAAWHHVERYANNRVEADHAQLKRWPRPMRGIKTMTGLRVLAAGHAFVQNLRRDTARSPSTSHPELDSPRRSANWPGLSEGASPEDQHLRRAGQLANATAPSAKVFPHTEVAGDGDRTSIRVAMTGWPARYRHFGATGDASLLRAQVMLSAFKYLDDKPCSRVKHRATTQ